MKRRLFNLLTVLSLLLCVAAAGMWVRSGRTFDLWSRNQTAAGPRDARGWSSDYAIDTVVSRQGAVQFGRQSGREYGLEAYPAGDDPRRRWAHGVINAPGSTLGRDPEFHWWMGLLAWHEDRPASVTRNWSWRVTGVEVHYWLVVLLAAPLPLARARRVVRAYVRERRRRGGLCLACAYDLRATPGRCPECGAVPSVRITG